MQNSWFSHKAVYLFAEICRQHLNPLEKEISDTLREVAENIDEKVNVYNLQLLAHLSRYRMAMIRRPSVRRPSVRPQFQRSSSLKPLGQPKPNFI